MENRITMNNQMFTPHRRIPSTSSSSIIIEDPLVDNNGEILIIEDDDMLGEIDAAENSSHSELSNDLNTYLNQILFNYYTSLSSGATSRSGNSNGRTSRGNGSYNNSNSTNNSIFSGWSGNSTYTSSSANGLNSSTNASSSSLHNSINQTQQIIDLNFGPGSSNYNLSHSHGHIIDTNINTNTRSSYYHRYNHHPSGVDPNRHMLSEEPGCSTVTRALLENLNAQVNGDGYIVDHQGIYWKSRAQRDLFLQSRQLDLKNFINIKDSYEKSKKNINTSVSYSTDYFKFKNFFRSAKPYLVHFQLRNLTEAIDKNAVIVSDFNAYKNTFEIKRLNPETSEVDVLIDQSKLTNSFNQDIKISTLAANDELVIAGSYTGDYLIYNNCTQSIYQDVLTTNLNGITNFIKISPSSNSVLLATNDSHLREFSLHKQKITSTEFPFAINSLSINPENPQIRLVVGDSLSSYIIDTRASNVNPVLQFGNHYDYTFCSDWSKYDSNLVATGHQDGTVIVNDVRLIKDLCAPVQRSTFTSHSSVSSSCSSPLFSFSSATNAAVKNTAKIGSDISNNENYNNRPNFTENICLGTYQSHLNNNNNSIRNVRFSQNRNFLCFAETIDNVNIVNLDNVLHNNNESYNSEDQFQNQIDNYYGSNTYGAYGGYSSNSIANTKATNWVSGQCIESFGKISGLCLNSSDSDFGEVLTIGISDHSVGGVLQFEFESESKCLDFDFF